MQSSGTILWQTLPRLIYTHNPFYLISALLVLVGLHQSLGKNASLNESWLLMEILCGYTALLAVVGFVVVRYGKVWEDARMILLVILLLFVAISVSFDSRVLDSPRQGARYLIAGLVFAVALSKCVFVSLQIQLRWAYRLPYYLILTLLFLYPLALGKLSVDGHDDAMNWGVFLFPVVGAMALLTLWPAARTPRSQEPANGTPWNWPWFPWTIFVVLAGIVALRTYSLSMAFESFKGSYVSFQPYFLSPLVVAIALLLLEVGIANGSQNAKHVAMMLPLAMLLVCLPGEPDNPAARRFLQMLMRDVASPAQLATWAATAFYALAAARGLRTAEVATMFCLALASRIDGHTLSLSTLADLQPWPLAVIALIELPLGLWRKTSWRMVVGSVAIIGACSVWGESLSQGYSTYILVHATVLVVLLMGAIYNDRWAATFRTCVSSLVPVAALLVATLYEWLFPTVPLEYHMLVVTGLSAISILYWRRKYGDVNLIAMLASNTALMVLAARFGYAALQASPLAPGMPWLAGGTFVLTLATLLSLSKGGVLGRAWQRLRQIHPESPRAEPL